MRAKRASADVKSDGKSWLGGLPALGDSSWPLDAQGRPLHHLAQIDLADAGPKLGVRGLPTTGALAFFASASENSPLAETAVRFIQSPFGPTEPPSALPTIGNHTDGGPRVLGAGLEQLKTFPRWALDIVPATVSGSIDTVQEELEAELGITNKGISARAFENDVPNGVFPSYWDSAQRFARTLERVPEPAAPIAQFQSNIDNLITRRQNYRENGFPEGMSEEKIARLIGQYEAKIESLKAGGPVIRQLAKDVADWAHAHSPWDVMGEDDLKQLRTFFAAVAISPVDQTPPRLNYEHAVEKFPTLGTLASETLQCMLTGPDEPYGSLPEAIRAHVDANCRVPNPPHQMFGPPQAIQTAAYDNESHHLLFQIAWDNLMGMRWGDMGAIQFWISPKDLASNNWDGCFSTFECH